MTRFHRLRFRRWVLIAAIVPGALGLAIGTAAAATAGGNPQPTYSAPTGYWLPGQGHDHKMREEAGDILIASGGIDQVDAFGPVKCDQGTDAELAPFLDRWSCGGDTVTVWHTAPVPVLDLVTCSVIIDQRDALWRFVSGTGGDQGVKGSGHITELALFSFPVGKDGRCEFDQAGKMMGDETDQPYMEDHGRVLRPFEFSVEEQFTGTAKIREVPPPEPCPTPTETYPVYGGTPSGAWPTPGPVSTCPSPIYS